MGSGQWRDWRRAASDGSADGAVRVAEEYESNMLTIWTKDWIASRERQGV